MRTDSLVNPTYITVAIKASKTDPFRKGVTVHIGATKSQLCPVAAVLAYMVQRGPQAGPFFLFEDSHRLTRDRLVAEVRRALERAGVDPSHYSGHSFRIGAATTAAACGLQDSLIKTLGRWESAAYTVYIRTTSPAVFSGIGETGYSTGRFVAVVDVCCITVQYRTGSQILDLGQGRRGAL